MNVELAIQTLRDNGYTVSKRKAKPVNGFADYDMAKIKNAKVAFPSPVIVAGFADGEIIRMSFATAVGKPLNVGRAVRVAVDAYDARFAVRQKRAIAEKFATEIEAHADVTPKREHCDEMREKVIDAAEALNALGQEPEYVYPAKTEEDKAKNSATMKWCHERDDLEREAEKWSDRYSTAIAHVAHAKNDVLIGLIEKHGARVKVPTITEAVIKLADKTVATLDLAKVNAMVNGKELH